MQEAPPFKTWIVVVALTAIIYCSNFVYVRYNPRVFHELDLKTETLLKNHIANCPDSILTVVVLGTSLVHVGVSQNSYFEKEAARLAGKDIRVFKIYDHSAYLEQFTEHSNVFDLLVKYPPDILFIEENLIAFHVTSARSNNFLMYEKLRSLYVNAKGKWIENSSVEIPFQQQLTGRTGNESTDTLKIADYLKEVANRNVRLMEENRSLHPYLDRLKQKGTKVILLNLPRPHPIEAAIHSGENELLFRKISQSYKQEYGIDYWKFDKQLPFSHFYDFAHMNDKGEWVFSEWFLHKINAKILNQ